MALAPLVVFIVWIGLKPGDFLPPLDRSVRPVLVATDAALHRANADSNPLAATRSGVVIPENDQPQEAIARVR